MWITPCSTSCTQIWRSHPTVERQWQDETLKLNANVNVSALCSSRSSLSHHDRHVAHEHSGGVTGGYGWVQTHPLSKKAPIPWDFSQIRRLFWGCGLRGVALREKKHELCQIVLNKQQHLHSTRCYYSAQLRSLIYCSDHCRFWNPIQSRFAYLSITNSCIANPPQIRGGRYFINLFNYIIFTFILHEKLGKLGFIFSKFSKLGRGA